MTAAEAVATVSWAFRLGCEGEGSRALAVFISFMSDRVAHGPPLADVERLLARLNATFAAQPRRDPLRLADLIEYELAPYFFDGIARA
jgi:hypothetical protein